MKARPRPIVTSRKFLEIETGDNTYLIDAACIVLIHTIPNKDRHRWQVVISLTNTQEYGLTVSEHFA